MEEQDGMVGGVDHFWLDLGSAGLCIGCQVLPRPAGCQVPIDAGLHELGGVAVVSFVERETRIAVKLAPLFFDLDHTLWDFESNSRHALRAGFLEVGLVKHGVETVDAWIEAYEKANEWCWAEFRHGRMDKATLRSERFRLAMVQLNVEPDPEVAKKLGDHYIATSPHQTTLIEGSLEVLDKLAKRGHDMWLLTNGFDEVQHIKVENSGLKPFFIDVYTSDSLGVKKPHAEAFHLSAQRAGISMDAGVVMIGDSWESDVEGAQNVGWRGVHFNPVGELQPNAWRSVRSLRELLDLPLQV